MSPVSPVFHTEATVIILPAFGCQPAFRSSIHRPFSCIFLFFALFPVLFLFVTENILKCKKALVFWLKYTTGGLGWVNLPFYVRQLPKPKQKQKSLMAVMGAQKIFPSDSVGQVK